MPQHPFPDPGPDGEEPGSSPLPPADEEGPAEDGPGLGQGLYVCLPAGQVTLEGFARNGEADTMATGPLAVPVNWRLGRLGDQSPGASSATLDGMFDFRHPHHSPFILDPASRQPAHR